MAAAAVVYVHGLWLTGHESLILRRRLASEFGFEVDAFRYATVSGGMTQIVARLRRHIEALAAPAVHLVGHSLGGLVIYRLLESVQRQPGGVQLPPGRVVFLGTPAVGSRAATNVVGIPGLSALVGRLAAEELTGASARRWDFDRRLGIIAGTTPLGLGRFFARFAEANDGTVAVSETRLPGAADHISLPASHMGLLLSARVASETGRFLRDGRFSLAPGQLRSASARSS